MVGKSPRKREYSGSPSMNHTAGIGGKDYHKIYIIMFHKFSSNQNFLSVK